MLGRILDNPVDSIFKYYIFLIPTAVKHYITNEHTLQLQGHKWINTGAYSLGVAASLALGVDFFLVAVLGFLGAAAFLGLVAFLVAAFLVAWDYNLRQIT